jgi:DNA-binding NarL/FixJ family response regulator
VSEHDPESPIRIFLLLRNRLLREALSRLLRKRTNLFVAGCSGPDGACPQTLLESQCDVLVLDFFDARWLPANLQIEKGGLSSVKSLLIDMSGDSELFLAAVRGGVTGYLLKESSFLDVVAAVGAIFHHEAICPPELCALLFNFVVHADSSLVIPSVPERPKLTIRQRQLMTLVAKGLTNKEIASRLNLSEFTVRNHIHRILKHVVADSRSHAVDKILSYGYSLAAEPSRTYALADGSALRGHE